MTLYKVVVSAVCPPIPTTRFDWCAYIEGEEDGTGSGTYGYGSTRAEAVQELCELVAEDVDFGPEPPLLTSKLFMYELNGQMIMCDTGD